MKRIRFSLRFLILLVTAVGLLTCASVWRRQSVLKLCEELEKEYFIFDVPNEWNDYIFQRKPTVGKLFDDGEKELLSRIVFRSGGDVWITTDDPETIGRLKSVGVVEYQ